MNIKTLHRAWVAAAVAAAAALPLAAQQEAPQDESTNVSEPITLRVRNYNWLDVRIYAVQGGQRYRLGTVTGLGTGEFRLPRWLRVESSDVRLWADPIGARGGYLSDTILAISGDIIEWDILNNIAQSYLRVRSAA